MKDRKVKPVIFNNNKVYEDLENKLLLDEKLTPKQLEVLQLLTKEKLKDKEKKIEYKDQEILEKL